MKKNTDQPPALPVPMTQAELDAATVRTRVVTALKFVATMAVVAYGLYCVDWPLLLESGHNADQFSDTQRRETIKLAFLFVVGIAALIWFSIGAEEEWNRYKPLKSSKFHAMNMALSARPELDAFREMVVQMGRPFTWNDYLAANTYWHAAIDWELRTERLAREAKEAEKLYATAAPKK